MKKLLLICLTAMILFTGTMSVSADEVVAGNQRDGGELVIVLDPGHDASHGGAVGGGVIEQTAVLKIGLYLKEELSKYENVKVYMTREGAGCAFPDTVGIYEGSQRCNEARVAYAESVNADVFIALHLNSFTSSTPNGAVVYVQNTNYDAEAGKLSQQLGQSIVNNLAELGLKNGGISSKNSTEQTHPEEHKYPDGSYSDYYRVLRFAKKVNMPAIIVEHAFLSNPSDVAKVLSSEEGLKALALKDAEGIVDFYGLTLKEGCVAGELPNIDKVPETQAKPTPEQEQKPTPDTETQVPEPSESEVPETEVPETEAPETESEIPEETETETVPEETETEMDTEGDANDVPPVDEEPKEIPWSLIIILAAAILVCGVAGIANFLEKKSAMQKDEE